MPGLRSISELAVFGRLMAPFDMPAPGSVGDTLDGRDAPNSRTCLHWPMNGPDGIRAASVSLHDLLQLWDQAERMVPESDRARSATRESVVVRGNEIDVDMLLLKAALAPDAARSISQSLAELAKQFSVVTQWLMRSAQASYDAVQRVPYQQQVLAVLRDDHRVIARDWLGADMNAAVARLLLSAARVLDSEDLSQRAIHDDLLGHRGLRVPLQAAATMLERAGHLASDCSAFVHSFDQQWLALRGEIASTMALCPQGDGAPLTGRQA